MKSHASLAPRRRCARSAGRIFPLVSRRCWAALCIVGLITPARGQLWVGGGANNFWTTAANWSGGMPTNDGTAFVQVVSNTPTLFLDTPWSVRGLSFNWRGIPWTFSALGATLSVGTGGIVNDSTSTQTLNLPIALTAVQAWQVGATWEPVNAGAIVANGVISGTGGITKTGIGPLTLTANNTFTGGLTINNGTVRVTTDANLGGASGGLAFGGGTLQATAGFSSARTVALNGNGTLDTNGFDLTLSGVISGGGSLVKTGNGALTLSGTNTFTGGTSVSTGTLKVGSDANLGATSSPVTIDGATLQTTAAFTNTHGLVVGSSGATIDTNGNDLTLSGVISGNGALTKTGGGTLTLAAANTYTGSLTIADGSLLLAHSLALQNNTLNAATVGAFSFGALTSATLGALTGTANVALNNASSGGVALTVGNNGASTSYSGVLSGSGSLIKAGAGTFTLAGTNTFTGGVTLNGGALSIASDANLGAASGGLTFGGGTLRPTASISSARALAFNSTAAIDTNGFALTLSGNAAGAGGLAKTGTGTLTLSGTNTYTGATTIAGGTVAFARRSSLYNQTPANWTAANLIVNSGATAAFNVGGSGEFTASDIAALAALGTAGGGFTPGSSLGLNAANGGGTFNVSGTLADPNGGANALGLQVLGGTVALSGANTYTGGTTVAGGTLIISSDANLGGASGALTLSGGTLQTGAALSSARNLSIGSAGGTINTNGNALTLSGVLSGAGDLVKSGTGTLTLSGANTFTGTTSISAGTLALGHSLALQNSTLSVPANGGLSFGALTSATVGGLSGSNNLALTNASNGAVTLTVGANNGSTIYSGALSGAGGLTKTGSGTQTLAGTSTHTGATNVNAGRLSVTGSAASSSFTVNGGVLSGSGTIGPLTVASGGTVAPGTSVGQLAAGATTWSGGGAYHWEINQTGGTAGASSGWDLLSISGALSIGATSGNKFAVNLTSLTSGGAAGAVGDFSSDSNYSFTFLTTTGGITGFNAGAFAIDTTNFQNPFGGTWSIEQNGNSLTLNYAKPPPATFATWSGGGDGNWSSSANWQGLAVPANNGTATVQLAATSNIDTPWHVAGVTYSGTVEDSLNGTTLTIGSGGITATAEGLLWLNAPVVLSANQTWSTGNGGGYVLQTGALDLNGKTLTVSGIVNPFHGAVALNSGTLVLAANSWHDTPQNAHITGNGTISVTGGSWAFRPDYGDVVNVTGTVSASGGGLDLHGATVNGTISISGGGIDLSGGTFTGNIAMSGGSLTLQSMANPAATHAAVVNTGTLNVDSSVRFSSLTGNGTVSLNGGLISSALLAFPGTLSPQVGTYTFESTPLLQNALGGAYNVPAGSTFDVGTLTNPTANALNSNYNVVVSNGVTLAIGGINTSSTYSGTVTGNGTLAKVGTGTLTANGTLSANTTVSAGTLSFTGAALSGNISIASGGNFELNQAGNYTYSGSGAITGTGPFSKNGAGYLILTSANAISAPLNIVAGSVAAVHPNALQNSTVDVGGGRLTFYSPEWNVSGGNFTTIYTLGPYTTAPNLGALSGSGAVDIVMDYPYSRGSFSVGNVVLSVGSNNASTTFSGTMSDVDTHAVSRGGSLVKVGSGTLTLAGENSYSGGTTISAGTLQLGNGGASGSITGNVTNHATLAFNRSDAVTFPGVISGTGIVTKAGAGTLTFPVTAANSYTGGTLITGGLIEFSAIGSFGSGNITLNGGGLKWAAGTSTDVSSRLTATLGSNGGVFDTNGSNVTLSTAFGGTGALTKQGNGTLTLSSATTFTGTTTVTAGTLALGHSLALQNSAATLSGGTLGFGSLTSATLGGLSGSTDLALANSSSAPVALTVGANNASSAYSGALSGAGSVTKTGNGTLTFTGNNTFSGGTTISAGTLQIGAGGTSGALAGSVVDHGTLAFNRSDAFAFSGAISGTGALTKSGAGTLTLSASNSYSGGSTLSAGTVALGSNTALGTGSVALNGASIEASGGTRTLSNALTLNSATTIGGSNALTFSGPVTLTGFNPLTVSNSAQTTLSGSLGESSLSSLIKLGGGELQLTGANTYTGGTIIGAGTVRINNSSGSAFGSGAVTVASGATLAGSGSFSGSLTLNGNYSPGNSPGTQNTGSQTWNGGASLTWELNNATGTAGTNWDKINISGGLTINATNASPFTINLKTLDFSNNAGAAANLNDGSNYSFSFVSTTSGISGFAADRFSLNTSGVVNALTGTWSIAQIGNDLNLVYTVSAIPEPSTYAMLAGAGALGLALRRRRRQTRGGLAA